ncbi:MCP four helix bundle domain-containing protein, partial [Pseudomonas helleri]
MKNWTLRQRILASFAVIIAIMLLMVVASYSRLLSIESSEETVRTDSIPGVYYSSMVRSAWVDSYVLTLQLVGSATQRDLTSEDRKLYASYEDRMNQELDNYRTTIFDDQDRAEFDEFERIHGEYTKALSGVLQFYEDKKTEQADAMLNEQLAPLWAAGRKQLNTIIDTNRTQANHATETIANAVTTAKISMVISLIVAVLAAGLCGYLLLQAIMSPMQRIVSILETMRSGDLSSRLNLDRKDEFGAVETGFNDMMTELTALVSQAQRSSVQVTTSVTEIAATSKQQQATATETAATTTEIGATSREIAATSRDLVRTMTEVTSAADQASILA